MPGDWTTGAAKWAAVFMLGGASATGLLYSLFGRPSPAPVIITASAPAPTAQLASPEPHAAVAPPTPEPSAILAAPAPLRSDPERPAEATTPPAPSLTRTININTAPASELELLPGIG